MAGKKVVTPRHRILSGRVSDEDYEEFKKLAADSKTTLSNLVRDVMIAWKRAH